MDILYIGSGKGPEAKLIPKIGIKFQGVLTGKLRRYFSLKNFLDFFKIPIGFIQSFFILKKFKPSIVFSKGGYVSIPVIFAAHALKIPIVLHESDASPGLANKMAAKKANEICLSYLESSNLFPPNTKKTFTGNPIREELLKGDSSKGYSETAFNKEKPVILIMGGSQGAQKINETVFNCLNELTAKFQIIHICGKGKIRKDLNLQGYKAYEYVNKMLPHLYAITNLIISRSGANSLAEINALDVPSILIPIGSAASRGEQYLNAIAHRKLNPETIIIENEKLDKEGFIKAINEIMANPKTPNKKDSNAVSKIIEVIEKFLK